MKKIAVSTMTCDANYGNALQNYAVLKLIERHGYEAETLRDTTKKGFVDEIPEKQKFVSKLKPSYIKNWRNVKALYKCGAKNDADLENVKYLEENISKWKSAIRKKNEAFDAFQKEILKYTNFEISSNNFNLDKIAKYDAFVAGSDQVWNPNYRTNSMIQFLQMAPPEKRIAFVPSFGVSELPDCRKMEFAGWIDEIPYLSVRENEGAKIIKDLTGRDAKVLLDPTFGLTKEEWLSFVTKPKGFTLEPGTYVFCYFLGNRTKDYTNYINEYAAKHSCKVIDVLDAAQLENYSYSPSEFTWLLANARASFTDSFHGTALSINLEKPFVVFDRVGDGCITQSSRITTVLGKTGFEDRKYEKLPIDNIDSISFDKSSGVITSERSEMLEFLQSALDEATAATPSIHLATKRHCTGCSACEDACPVSAITMTSDNEGFLYPVIDDDRCIKCHKCEAACPADHVVKFEEDTKVYYAFSNNEEICKKSSSGGLFSELARNVIAEGGIVFGAGYDDEFNVCHMSAETEDELSNLRTSKYVQSNTEGIYKAVSENLKAGRKVMFSGTPCQVAALKNFIDKDSTGANKNLGNLLLIDIICHGVPSPGLWKKYLEEEHGDKKIEKISFRNKDIGWNDFSMRIDYEDKSFYRELAVKDSFESSFLANLSLRPSCYQCQYKTVERVSDITIADYWGAELVYPKLKDQQGVSLVLIHSKKGEEIFASLKDVTIGETDLTKAISMNHACEHSSDWPEKRNLFFSMEKEFGIKKAADECLKLTAAQKAKRFVYRNGARVKKIIRKN